MNIRLDFYSKTVPINNVDMVYIDQTNKGIGSWNSEFDGGRTVYLLSNEPFMVYHTKHSQKRVAVGKWAVQRLTNQILMGEVLT